LGYKFKELVAPDLRLHQDWLAVAIDGMEREHVFSEINADYGRNVFAIPICC
jgi:hypothetical protein